MKVEGLEILTDQLPAQKASLLQLFFLIGFGFVYFQLNVGGGRPLYPWLTGGECRPI
ncbi:MAG: hypothetical protein AB1861_05620 [Cyanobacteriota bacterium]